MNADVDDVNDVRIHQTVQWSATVGCSQLNRFRDLLLLATHCSLLSSMMMMIIITVAVILAIAIFLYVYYEWLWQPCIHFISRTCVMHIDVMYN